MRVVAQFALLLALGLSVAACGGDGSDPWSAPYAASRSSDPFHESSCRWVEKIAPKNLRTFDSRQEAINAGHRPCRTCGP